ncbi:DUF3108 domain-containing protein [Gracilimonas halophila]|uniref:DUF3108 domain-containing protein n=1 Tax=Gracilimonas halophila TaxID=1834464 RepID=A0ABW5JNF5_9BACT
MKKVLLLLFTTLLVIPAFAQHDYPSSEKEPPDMEELFSVKETFRYEVKYGFFKLGWVNVRLLSDTLYQDQERKHILTEIESNGSIPFVGDELDQYHSLFYVNEDGLPVESKYWKDNVDEEEYEEIVYWFDRDLGKVYYKEEDDTRDTLDLEDPATSGHLIFYFSRLFAGSEENFKLPVYVTKKKGYIYAENSLEKEERRYKPFDEPIMAYRLDGSTENIEGPFGFSGDFRAWYLDDDLRVPLEARVKVFWGNVIVRLIEYTREEL